MNRRRRQALMLAAAGLLTVAPPARAHAALVKSDPARRATLTRPPKQIRLWFSERLEPAYASVTLRRDGDANDIETAKATVDAGDPKLLVLELPELAPGDYTVKYRVLSVDGHTVDYGYTFSIRP